jgi:hypothetical protein
MSIIILVLLTSVVLSLPISLHQGLINERIGDASTDRNNLYVTTFSDTSRIIKFNLGDLSRLNNFDLGIAAGVTFANAVHVSASGNIYLFGYRYTNIGSGQYGPRQASQAGFGPPVLAKIRTNGDINPLVKQISIPRSNSDGFTCSPEGSQPTKLFSDNNYLYLAVTVDQNSTLYRYNANTLDVLGSVAVGTRSFVGVSNQTAVFVGGNVVTLITLPNLQKRPDVTLQRRDISDPAVFRNHLYFSRTYRVDLDLNTYTVTIQTQAIAYDIYDNFKEASLLIGPPENVTIYVAISAGVKFVPDLNPQSPTLLALRYTTTQTPSGGHSTSSYKLFKITIDSNIVLNGKFEFPDSYTNFCAEGGGPVPGPTFFLNLNGIVVYAADSGVIRRVNTRVTPAIITNSVTLSKIGTDGAASLDRRGDKLIFTTTTGQIGTISISTGESQLSNLPLYYRTFSSYYIDPIGSYAYIPQVSYTSNSKIARVNLDNMEIVNSYTLEQTYEPFASMLRGNRILFFLYRHKTYSYDNYTGNPSNFAIFDVQRNTITQSLDITLLEINSIGAAIFSDDGKYVYCSCRLRVLFDHAL